MASAVVWRQVARPDETLADWFQTFRVLQAAEVWACHGDWVTSAQPVFGPGIKDRFQVRYVFHVKSCAPPRRGVVGRILRCRECRLCS
jgi:hypothetical protein